MLPAPRFLFVLIVLFGSVAAVLLLRKKFPNKRFVNWTPWILATIAAFFIVFLVGAFATSKNKHCGYAHQTESQPIQSPLTAQDYFDEGNYEYDRGNCQEAIINYSIAIDVSPDFSPAYNNRAYTYMMMNDYKDALPDLDKAIALRPDYVNALINRGDIYNYYYNRDRSKAITDYDRVIALGKTEGTSVCGHRMLAMNGGWSLKQYWQIVTKGFNSGCN